MLGTRYSESENLNLYIKKNLWDTKRKLSENF